MRLTLLAVFMAIATAFVKSEVKITETYDVNGTDTLRLDFYRAETKGESPVMIFAFGGGFKGGSRDDASFKPMFEYLVRNGVSVASVDYRTLLKDVTPERMMSAEGFKANLVAAIDTAAVDFLRATAYIISESGKLGVDTTRIFACGSSAGAITVLQAEYTVCNLPEVAADCGLPAGFNYSGVISMAGAVCSNGAPVWSKRPCSMLLFHGDADAIVPFEKATLDGFGLWGSKAISDGLTAAGIPHRFHRVDGASHEVAGTPMTDNPGEIHDFIRAICEGRNDRITKTVEKRPGQEEYKTDFSILDYIKANL